MVSGFVWTGKKIVATNTILNQQGQYLICVYLATGQKNIFCDYGSDYFLGKGRDGIYCGGSRNYGFPYYIRIYIEVMAEYFYVKWTTWFIRPLLIYNFCCHFGNCFLLTYANFIILPNYVIIFN